MFKDDMEKETNNLDLKDAAAAAGSNAAAKNGEYGEEQIQVLEGLEAVRKRPGMYIGSTGPRGLHHLVYEIVDNSIDEAMAGVCTHIRVVLHADGSVSVRDNGRGVPAAIHHKMGIPTLEVVFTVLHAGGKFGGAESGYKISGGLHGVGASVVNALSEWMEIENRYGGRRYTERFERGKVARPFAEVENAPDPDPLYGMSDGLYVRFMPDREIFEDIRFDFSTLETRLREQAFLNAGLSIILRDERPELLCAGADEEAEADAEEDSGSGESDGNAQTRSGDIFGDDDEGDASAYEKAAVKTKTYYYEGGIRSFVEHLTAAKHSDPIHPDVIYMKRSDEATYRCAEVALQYNDGYSNMLLTFANNINTAEGGSHETGFKRALSRAINDYARKSGAMKSDDRPLTADDVLEGICAVVSVKLPEAQFEGQTKTKLGNTDIRAFVENMVYEKLGEYLEETPACAKAIVDKALCAASAR